MRARLRVARWALLAAVDEIGDDPGADDDTLATVMTAKRHAVAGGPGRGRHRAGGGRRSAFFRTSALERAYRDVRGGPFHPLTPEATLAFVGERALAEAAG